VLLCTEAERRRRPSVTAGQLDDIRQGKTQLFFAWSISFLLQRATEHVPATQAAPRLCRLHYSTVSIHSHVTAIHES